MERARRAAAKGGGVSHVQRVGAQGAPRIAGIGRPTLSPHCAASPSPGNPRSIADWTLGLAHDIGNVLGALNMQIATLLRDGRHGIDERRSLEVMQRTAREGAELLARLQEPERGAITLLGDVDLLENIHTAVEIALRGGPGALGRLQVRIEAPPGPPPIVVADAGDVRRVFVNLLLNACEAMAPGGGTIMVRLALAPEGMVRVRVEDTGPGIRADVLPRIFDRFVTTKGEGGHGLGLASAKSAAERWGGTIIAINRPGGGARFDLVFRRAASPSRARSRAEANRPSSPGRYQSKGRQGQAAP